LNWLWTLLNKPKIQLTTLQEMELIGVALITGLLFFCAVMFAWSVWKS